MVCALLPAGVDAQFPNYPEPNLPELKSCLHETPQPLPAKWEAITLMAPYLYTGEPHNFFKLPERASLRVGKLVYDAKAKLMRATLVGVSDPQTRPLDLLITDGPTYVLDGDHDQPRCMAEWHTTYQVPPRIWQSEELEATCVGNHRTPPDMEAGPEVDWWKQRSPITSPGAQGQAADWYWMDANGYPTRTMFWDKHDALPAILGDYAYTHFYRFEPLEQTHLKSIYETCLQHELPVIDAAQWAEASDNDHAKQTIQPSDWIPGLSYRACRELKAQPPSWPVDMYATSLSTAAKYDTPKPLPTSVHYQPQIPRIRTRLHKLDDQDQEFFSDALLTGTSSYGVDTEATAPYDQLGCAQGPHTSLPGSPYPYWGNQGACQCFGIIEDNDVLSPNRTTQLIGCPLPLVPMNPGEQQGNTLFWMWYTVAYPPQPIVFLQTQPDVTIGTGLSLADYVYWNPQPVPDEIFTLPTPPCFVPLPEAPTPPPACLKCHIQSNNE